MKTAAETSVSVSSRQVTAASIAAAALDRAAASQQELNAFISLLPERAAAVAEAVDGRVADGEQLPLAGVPVAVKDNLLIAGERATAGSRFLSGFVPPYTATTVQRLEVAGAVPVGKANMDEFGMGSSNENSGFGPVMHPFAEGRVPGGSSGGSAAAVAAGIVPLALGTDTGGSVRQPASFCGLVGLKPGYGRLSRYGVMSLAMSFDQVGIMARTVADVRLALEAMDGPDELDSVSVAAWRRPVPEQKDTGGLRVGVLTDLGTQVAPGVTAALGTARTLLQDLGASLEEAELASIRFVSPTYLLLCAVEASSALARFDGMTFGARAGEDALGQERVMQLSRGAGLGREVRRRVLIGSLALSEANREDFFERAIRARRIIRDELLALLDRYDVLLSPTTPTVAFGLGRPRGELVSGYREDTATNLANLAALPAISMPGLTAEDGLPIGMQLIGRPMDEATLLAVAERFTAAV